MSPADEQTAVREPHPAQGLGSGGPRAAGARPGEQHQVVAERRRLALHADQEGVVRVLHIGGERGREAEDSEEVVAGGGQPPGGRVGYVAEAAGRLQDPPTGLLGDDASLAVGPRGEHQGHGRLGHPREPGHLGLPGP